MRLFSRTPKEILRIASHFSSILYLNGRFSLLAEKIDLIIFPKIFGWF